MSDYNPYGNQSGYASQFQNGSGAFNRNPVMQQQQMGVPGISTGNMFMDMFVGNMLGPNVLPKPNANQSMMEAMTLRRRSLEGFNRMGPGNFANNAFSQNFGGFQGAIPQIFNAVDSFTGGPGNGAISKFLSPLLNGNPIQAQQKLYAGSNGISSTAAFGLRGETSFNTTNGMMKDMSKWFYKQDRNNADIDKVISGHGITAANGDTLGLTAALKKAISNGETKDAIEKLAATFGTSLKKGVSEALSVRGKTTLFEGVNGAKSFGYNQEDITGAWVTMQHKGLIQGRPGQTAAQAFREFGEAGGMGTVRAAQNLFGSKDASGAMSDMNDFIGVGGFNANSKTDRDRFSHMAHSMEATSLSSGISKADLLQLTESIREVSKQSGMGKAVGGVEAANMAMSAVRRATNVAAGQSIDFLRQNGGIAGYTQKIAAQMAEDDASAPASTLAGLYGYVDKTFEGRAKTDALAAIRARDKEMRDDPNKAGITDDMLFKEKFGKRHGLGVTTLSRIGSDSTNVANGKSAIGRYNTENNTDYNFSDETTGAAKLNAVLGSLDPAQRKSMQTAIESSSNPKEQIDTFNKLERAAGRGNNTIVGDKDYGALLMQNGSNLHGATATGRATAAKDKAETDLKAKRGAEMEQLWAGARTSLVGSVAQALLSGSAASGGFEAIGANHMNTLIANAKNDPELLKKLTAVRQLTEESTRKTTSLGSVLSAVGNTTAGGYIGDVSLSDLEADTTKDAKAGARIQAMREKLEKGKNSTDKKIADQAKAMQEEMFDKDGKLKKGAGKSIMHAIGLASQDFLYGTNEHYKALVDKTNGYINEDLKGTDITLDAARKMGAEGILAKRDEIKGDDKESVDRRDKLNRVADNLKMQKGAAEGIEAGNEATGKDIMTSINEALGKDSPLVGVIEKLIGAISEAK